MATLSIAVIGSFQATVNAQVVTSFQSNKVRALLAFLAVEPTRWHSRETLAGLLWPDYPNPSALTYLRNALSNLRQVIGDVQAQPHYLVITRGSIQLNPASDLWIDLRAFEELIGKTEDSQSQITSLQSAIALYRGPFLDGFSCDSSAFEEWALTRRERVNRQLRDALSRLAGAYAQRGDHTASIQTARRLLELEPWDEAAHRLVMQGLARSGQRSAALAQYEACRRILQQELGVDPAAETQALLDAIRSGELGPQAGAITLEEQPVARAQPHLPAPLTSFIGRESELVEIQRLLGYPAYKLQPLEGKTRLLTLVGAGGCGKTRLAIAAGHILVDSGCYTNGVWWVDLSPISDPGLVLSTVAAAFGLAETGRTPLQQLLLNYLREKELLLILDNSEHLIDATAQLVEKLLVDIPGLQILVTSREPLGVPGEMLWRVPSLTIPDSQRDQSIDLDAIRRFDAVRLFDERARAALPDWSLDGNAVEVVEICTRLDGIPLAIELAASRLRMMTVSQIAERLDDTFHLLTGGSRTALPRHQTLRACIDWSYNLLSPAEAALLRQLSVFQGGWTLEAVEYIGKNEPIPDVLPVDILTVLAQLMDRSLVVGHAKGRGMRYRLLDTIRQYAHEKLVEAGEEQAACRRHLAFFLDLAIRAEGQLRGPEQVQWHEKVKAELENIRAALAWALRTNPLAELRIASALFWFWRTRPGWIIEGLNWLEQGLDVDAAKSRPASTDEHERAQVRGWALNVATWFQGSLLGYEFGWSVYRTEAERQAARTRRNRYSEEAISLFQALGKPGRRGLAFALVMKDEANLEREKKLLEESYAIFEEEGDKFYMAQCLLYMGNLARIVGDYEQARAFYQQHLDLRIEIGDVEGLGFAHLLYGKLEFEVKRYSMAKAHYEEALAIYKKIGVSSEYIFRSAQDLADLAIAQSEYTEALKYSEIMFATARESGEEWQYAYRLHTKGTALITLEPVQAGIRLCEALKLFQKMGDKEGIILNLASQVLLAVALNRPERAARLLGAALQLRDAEHLLLYQVYIPEQENLRSTIQTALGEQAFAKAWAEGETMTLDQTVAYALDENAS